MNEHDSVREDNKKPLGVLSSVGSNPTPGAKLCRLNLKSKSKRFSNYVFILFLLLLLGRLLYLLG